MKDGFSLVCFLVVYAWFVFFIPNYLEARRQLHRVRIRCSDAGAYRAGMVLSAVYYAILRSIPDEARRP